MRHMKKIITLLFLVSSLQGQNKIKVNETVKWTASYTDTKNETGEILLKANIELEWHLYSQEESVDGPVPTTIKFEEENEKFELIGKTTEPSAEKKFDEAFAMEISSFTGEVIFRQNIQRKTKAAFTLRGTVEYMTCNNVQCNPPRTISFEVKIPALP
jgi:hypothetical protein